MSEPPARPRTASAVLGASMGQVGRWLGRARLPGMQTAHRQGDWSLWHAACAGDEASATLLVRQLTPQARGLALQMLSKSEDAEDVVQEAFLRLWGSRPSDAQGATLATYFNTIVINRCKTWLTRRRELCTDEDTLTEWADARQLAQQPPDATWPGPCGDELQGAMARLPARQRMALAMWAYGDADVAQIARALELERNAAHQLLHRAKLALRQQLEGRKP